MSRHQSTISRKEPGIEHGYRVIYERLSEGGYQVIVPALPGIVTYGRTLQEARDMARDAIVCHLRGLLKDGEEIPEDPFAREQPRTEELRVTV
jgi:antitoxin HicB